MISYFISFHFLLYSIQASLFCNQSEEVHYETWCYKLYDINLFINFKECWTQNSTQSNHCLKNKIDRFLDIYLLNSRIDNFYEFTLLDSPFKGGLGSNIYSQLIEKKNLLRNDNFDFINIFFNVYSYQNHGYIENKPLKIQNPNLLKHSDSHMDNSTEKCLFVQQTKNLNEKFSFKYGDCDKNFTFICIKSPKKVNNVSDRCSSYLESSPGGKWIECDELFQMMDTNPGHLISNSQKCCMYNFNWKVNFSTANRICSQFNSEVFTFESKGFKSILNSYDLYLDLNPYHSSLSEYTNFWTSCKIINYPFNHEFICGQDLKKREQFDFEYPLDNGFLLYYLHYSFKNLNGFKILKLNISQIFKNFDLIDFKQFIKNISENVYLLVRRKETRATNLTTNLVGMQNKSCFNYHLDNEEKISFPILDKCFHFKTVTMNEKNYSEIFSIDKIKKVLNFFDFKSMICLMNTLSDNSIKLSNLKPICSNFLEKNQSETLVVINDKWLSQIVNIPGKKLVFEYITDIEKILYLNCYDSAKKIQNLINDCKKFYFNSFCKFKCPLNCDFNSDKYQIIIWQIGQFKYNEISSICKSAYHSNKTEGLIYFSKKKNSNKTTKLINNGIDSLKWPVFNKNTTYESENFYFQNPVLVEQQKISKNFTNTLVLLKAIYFVRKNKFNSISINIFSDQRIDQIKLKYMIPLFDDFFDVEFTQKNLFSNNVYQSDLSVNLPYKKLIFVNNYFEIHDKEIKIPINLANIDYEYFLLKNPQLIRILSNQTSKMKFQQIRNLTRPLNCFWHLYNLNTLNSCIDELSFSSNNSTLGTNLIFYPKTEDMDLNFFKKFIRVIFVEKNFEKKCLNGGYFKNHRCICYPGFGGDRCEKTCKIGKFGHNCEYECPNRDCKGYLICNIDPIGCSCISGLNGFFCDEVCPEHKWGPMCSFECKDCHNNMCNSYDGSCNCNDNFVENCDSCKDGFFGENCTKKCVKSCFKCHRLNGKCLDNYLTKNVLNSTKRVKEEKDAHFDVIFKMLKCEENNFFNIYTSNSINKSEKSISCFLDKKSKFQYCNFIKREFNQCALTTNKTLGLNSDRIIDLITDVDFIFLKLKSLHMDKATFIIRKESKFFLLKKIIFVLVNSSDFNESSLLFDILEGKFVSMFIFCYNHDVIYLDFKLSFYNSCSNYKTFHKTNLSQGYYYLFTILELYNEQISYKTWIKRRKFIFYLSSGLIEKCSVNEIYNFTKCEIFKNEIFHPSKCKTINILFCWIILLSLIFLVLLFENLKEISTKKYSILFEENILQFELNNKFNSSF